MGLLSGNNDISRRAAIARLGASALGLAFMNSSSFASETTDEALHSRLPKFSERSRALLSQVLEDPAFSGRIPTSAVEALAKSENASVDELMMGLLPLAKTYSRAPISNFLVGVVVRGASGSLYLGANIEISGQCLGFAVHAEQAALSNAYMNSEAIRHLAGSGGRRALRPLPAIHGRDIACRRNADSDSESSAGQADVDSARGLRTFGPGSNAGSPAHPENEPRPQRQ